MYSYHTFRISWLHILAEKQLGHISQCINLLPHRANACLCLLSYFIVDFLKLYSAITNTVCRIQKKTTKN